MSDLQTKSLADTALDPARALLHEAINASNLDRVRDILREVCAHSTQAFDIACERLLVKNEGDTLGSESEGSEDEDEEDDEGIKKEEDEELPLSPNDKKREACTLRYEICKQCEKEYDVEDNFEEACNWHPGDVEVERYLDELMGAPRHDRLLYPKRHKRADPDALVYTCCETVVGGTDVRSVSIGQRRGRRGGSEKRNTSTACVG